MKEVLCDCDEFGDSWYGDAAAWTSQDTLNSRYIFVITTRTFLYTWCKSKGESYLVKVSSHLAIPNQKGVHLTTAEGDIKS
jgi:hypothetical protein